MTCILLALVDIVSLLLKINLHTSVILRRGVLIIEEFINYLEYPSHIEK